MGRPKTFGQYCICIFESREWRSPIYIFFRTKIILKKNIFIREFIDVIICDEVKL